MVEETNTVQAQNIKKDTPPRSKAATSKRPHRAKNKVGATLSPLDKAKAKAAFLLSMSRRNNITEACEAAHVDY